MGLLGKAGPLGFKGILAEGGILSKAQTGGILAGGGALSKIKSGGLLSGLSTGPGILSTVTQKGVVASIRDRIAKIRGGSSGLMGLVGPGTATNESARAAATTTTGGTQVLEKDERTRARSLTRKAALEL